MKKCTTCGEEKPEDAFCWKNKARGRRSPSCKECKNKYNKNWYSSEDNRQKQITRAKTRNAVHWQSLSDWRNEYIKWRGGCSYEGCEVDNPVMIDFDHISREDKEWNVSEMIVRGMPIHKIEKEADKCRLLCANHHRLWTAEQMGWRNNASVSPLASN